MEISAGLTFTINYLLIYLIRAAKTRKVEISKGPPVGMEGRRTPKSERERARNTLRKGSAGDGGT